MSDTKKTTLLFFMQKLVKLLSRPTTPLRFVMGSTPEKSINRTSPQTKYSGN